MRSLRTGALAIFLVIIPTCALPEEYGYVPDAAVYLGAGFDPVYPGRVYPLCIKARQECQSSQYNSIGCLSSGVTTSDPTRVKFGVTTSFSVRQIQSKYDFFKEVNINLSMSGSYGPFSASGSFSSYAMDEIKEDSLSWMVMAKSHYGTFSLAEPALDPIASKIKTGAELVARCGSSYVAEVDRGVVAAAVFSVYNLDQKSKREIEAKLSGGFSAGFDVSGAASFKEIVKQATQYGSMSIRVYTIGGEASPGLATIIEKNPTDLNEIKTALKEYVANQDISRSSVIAFRTTGFGKLTNRPSIDPDQSNYLYFLENANSFRLRLLDALSSVDALLERQIDFDKAVVDQANSFRDHITCELQYVETQIQACRMSTELVTRTLLDGTASNDGTGAIALNYGISATNGVGVKVCPAVAKLLGEARPLQERVATMGWTGPSDLLNAKRGLVASPAAAGPPAAAQAQSCEARVNAAQTRYSQMINSVSPGKGKVDRCVTGCSFEGDLRLLGEVRTLPKFPFNIRYWYDGLTSTFGGAHTPGLYLIIGSAQKVRQLTFYTDKESTPFAVKSVTPASTITAFASISDLSLVSAFVKIIIETDSHNTYSVILPKVTPK